MRLQWQLLGTCCQQSSSIRVEVKCSMFETYGTRGCATRACLWPFQGYSHGGVGHGQVMLLSSTALGASRTVTFSPCGPVPSGTASLRSTGPASVLNSCAIEFSRGIILALSLPLASNSRLRPWYAGLLVISSGIYIYMSICVHTYSIVSMPNMI